jgi:hypothetical protein
MKTSLSPSPESSEKIPLLREALEVLVGELSVLAEHKAEDLPELKKKKVVLASRLGKVDRMPLLPEPDAFDLATLTSLIHALEAQSRQEIRSHLELLGKRLLALQEEHQYWRECLNVSFGKFCEPVA